MKAWPIIAFFFSLQLSAQTVTPLSEVDLEGVTAENRPLVHRSTKFNIFLTNGFCSSEKARNILSKEILRRNVVFYRRHLPHLLEKFEALVKGLKADFFWRAPDFYPLNIHLSIDGDENCYNATAEANHIEVPAQNDPAYLQAVFNLLYHELGHTLGHFNRHDQNLFDETIADAISLLLHDGHGLFPLGARVERVEWKRQLELGTRDPHALAAELEVEYSSIPSWLKENELKYKCSSDEYYRDFRTEISLSDGLLAGGESYIVSCAFHSYLRKLGNLLGKEAVLKTFVRAYLNRPLLFNEIDFPKILRELFPWVSHQRIDPSFGSLALTPIRSALHISLNRRLNEEEEYLELAWKQPRPVNAWGVLGLRNARGEAIGAYSLYDEMQGALSLIAKTPYACKTERLLCHCPVTSGSLQLELAWLGKGEARKQQQLISLPRSAKGCFEIALQNQRIKN